MLFPRRESEDNRANGGFVVEGDGVDNTELGVKPEGCELKLKRGYGNHVERRRLLFFLFLLEARSGFVV